MKKYDTKVRKQSTSLQNTIKKITIYIVVLCLLCGKLNMNALAYEINPSELTKDSALEETIPENNLDEIEDNATIDPKSTVVVETPFDVYESEEETEVGDKEKEVSDKADEEVEDEGVIAKDETIRSAGYIEDDFIIPSIVDSFQDSFGKGYEAKNFAASYSSNTSEVIPASYSSKDLLPAVRDQGNYGVCWSFAALGMAEASIISKGIADKNIDLSELQLAYFFYHSVTDPLGNTMGDKNELLQGNYLSIGGNSVFTTFALANWVGAADEAKAPYDSAMVSKTLNSGLAYDDAYHMQNAYWINMATDTQEVKQMIMEYGAVASAFYTDQTSATANTASYNASTYAYYYNGSYTTNHAITIVGWDDNYGRTNFNASKQPEADGAWLIRNSWGKGMGEDGYFWISYEDSAFNSQNYSKAFVFDFESGDNYDHNYQYDGASGISKYALNSGGSIANIFTAAGNTAGTKEQIEAVSFALYDVNVDYSIQIYTGLTDESNPISGTQAFTSEQTGSTTYVGYYTIPLNETVIVEEGEKFSVVITLLKSGGEATYFFTDYSYQNGDWIKFTNATAKGQSFRKNGSGSNWTDMNSLGLTARIKAFTTNTTIQEETNVTINPIGITLNHDTLQLNKGESTVLTATILPANVTDKSVTWSVTDSDIATVSSDGTVTALNKGTTMITVTTVNGIIASCELTVKELEEKEVETSVVDVTGVTLNVTELTMKSGDKKVLNVSIAPDTATNKEIKWTTSNNKVAKVSQSGEVTAIGIGNALITATSNNNITVSINLTVKIGKTANLKTLSQSTTSIRLGWSKQYGVSGYEIYRYDLSKKKYVKIATNSKESKVTYTDKKRESATTYKYKIRVYVKKNGKKVYGAYSDVLTTTTKTQKPILTASSSNKKAKLTWNKVSGATGYEIVMSTKKDKGFTKIKTITKSKNTSYSKKQLNKGKTYYFKIRAYKTVKGSKVYSSYSKITAVRIN